MAFDPKIYRNSKDGIGSPSDTAATDSTSEWTIISLLKGIWAKLNGTLTVSGSAAVGTTGSVVPASADYVGINVGGNLRGATGASLGSTFAGHVAIVDGSGNQITTFGGSSIVDDAAFTVGTTTLTVAGGTYRSVRDTVDDNDAGALAMTQRRALYVSPESPAGDSLVDDTNDLLKVAIIPGQNGVAAGAGTVGATVQRATLASDDPAVTALQVIDDWDESDRAKVNIIVGQAGVAAGAGAVGVTVQRVTLASDDPAVTALQIIDDWDETDRAKVNLIVGQAGIAAGAGAVGATVPRVTHASDDPVTTAVQLIDDAIVADNAGFTDGTTKLDMSGYIFDEVAGTALTENDAAAARIDSKRAQVMVVEDATTRGQRQAVSAAGAASANIAQVAGATVATGNGTASGSLRVSLPTDGTGVVGLNAGTNLVGRAVADASAATGGIASTSRLLSAAGTSGDATNVKASAGRLYAIQGYNASSSVRYLKIYNTAGTPTAGSGTPVKTLALPPMAAFAFDWPVGYSFATGIGFTLVTGSADASSTGVTAADIVGLNFDYT